MYHLPPRTGANDAGPLGISSLPSWYQTLSIAGAAIGAYHGYKRNDSVGWAVGWALLGSAFPIVVIPVAFAQGIGDRAR